METALTTQQLTELLHTAADLETAVYTLDQTIPQTKKQIKKNEPKKPRVQRKSPGKKPECPAAPKAPADVPPEAPVRPEPPAPKAVPLSTQLGYGIVAVICLLLGLGLLSLIDLGSPLVGFFLGPGLVLIVASAVCFYIIYNDPRQAKKAAEEAYKPMLAKYQQEYETYQKALAEYQQEVDSYPSGWSSTSGHWPTGKRHRRRLKPSIRKRSPKPSSPTAWP